MLVYLPSWVLHCITMFYLIKTISNIKDQNIPLRWPFNKLRNFNSVFFKYSLIQILKELVLHYVIFIHQIIKSLFSPHKIFCTQNYLVQWLDFVGWKAKELLFCLTRFLHTLQHFRIRKNLISLNGIIPERLKSLRWFVVVVVVF